MLIFFAELKTMRNLRTQNISNIAHKLICWLHNLIKVYAGSYFTTIRYSKIMHASLALSDWFYRITCMTMQTVKLSIVLNTLNTIIRKKHIIKCMQRLVINFKNLLWQFFHGKWQAIYDWELKFELGSWNLSSAVEIWI